MALTQKAYAELVVVKAADLVHIPEGLDIVEAAALPLVTLTRPAVNHSGDKDSAGQTVLVTGAVGSVGRSAVWTAKKAGAVVIAGVKKSQLKEAEKLHADQLLALDDAGAMEKLGFIDAVADTVNGKTAEVLLGKVKQGGIFASVVGPPANARLHPTIHVESVRAVPDAQALRGLAKTLLRSVWSSRSTGWFLWPRLARRRRRRRRVASEKCYCWHEEICSGPYGSHSNHDDDCSPHGSLLQIGHQHGSSSGSSEDEPRDCYGWVYNRTYS